MEVGDLVKFVPFEDDDKTDGIGIIAKTHLLNDYTGATSYFVHWTWANDEGTAVWIRESYLEVIG